MTGGAAEGPDVNDRCTKPDSHSCPTISNGGSRDGHGRAVGQLCCGTHYALTYYVMHKTAFFAHPEMGISQLSLQRATNTLNLLSSSLLCVFSFPSQ